MASEFITDLDMFQILAEDESGTVKGSGKGNGKGRGGRPGGFGGGDGEQGFFFAERGPGNSRSSTFFVPEDGFGGFGGGDGEQGFFFAERGPGNSRSSTFFVPEGNGFGGYPYH